MSGLTEKIANIDSFVTSFVAPSEMEVSSITGDIDMFEDSGNNKELQIEGLKCIGLPESDEVGDRRLFFQTVWVEDISTGIVARDEIRPIASDEIRLLELCEQVAHLYYRELRDQFVDADIPERQRHLFAYINSIFPLCESGAQPTFKAEWIENSFQDVSSLIKRNPNSTELALIKAAGDNLLAAQRGEDGMLGEDTLMRLYRESVDFSNANECLASMVQQIAHRYPNMHILEVGGGAAGATSEVMRCLNNAFTSYTYTDTTNDLLLRAREELWPRSETMNFKMFDIQSEISSDSFEDHSFDLIIAWGVSRVKDPQATLLNIRRLLRPGGFLLLPEITGNTLRAGLVSGSLHNWLPGVNKDGSYKLCLSTVEWDALLRGSGFSGVQSFTHDSTDATKATYCVLVAQATDTSFDLIREPNLTAGFEGASDDLLIVGGSTTETSRLRVEFQSLISRWEGRVTSVDSIGQIDWSSMSSMPLVLSITELDTPLFADIGPVAFESLQKLFHQARKVLWITRGCSADNPYSNMTVGLGRTIASENAHLQLQFFDVDRSDQLTPRLLVETFLRFIHASSLVKSKEKMLWTLEPELKYQRGRLLIPRILPIPDMNDRLISRYRSVIHNSSDKEKYKVMPPDAHFEQIRVFNSSRYAIKVARDTYLHICLGSLVHDRSQRVLALSESPQSIIRVPRSWVFSCNIPPEREEVALAIIIGALVAQDISTLECAGNFLLFAEDPLLSDIISQRLSEVGRKVIPIVPTSAYSKEGGSVISIHPEAPRRSIRAQIPSEVSGILVLRHMDKKSSILRNLPPSCHQYPASNFFRTESEQTFISIDRNVLAPLFQKALNTQLTTSTRARASISCRDLESSSRYPFLTSVNWEDDTGPIPVKPIDPTSLFHSDRTYLLVGLTGDLGQSVCRWMVKNGVRYLVLSSRSPSVGDHWQRELELMGARVKVQSMDVTDKQALLDLRQVLLGEWPPLAGIANAAMVLSDSSFNDMSFENFDRVVKPKVVGSLYLDEVFRDSELDFFIMFSSLACVTGNPGQANYSAANMVSPIADYAV
jgi:hybrid polyketide synthase/nonribosomal peptide synthetase ACE1